MERQKVVSDRSWLRLWGSERKLSVDPEIIRTEEFIRTNFNYAGVLPMTEDGSEILLAGHKFKNAILWGPLAGAKEAGESPEETALREACEEAGGHEFANLFPPTVIIKATGHAQKMGIGLIYPAVVSKDIELKPNNEIQKFEWYYWSKVMELMDFELDVGADYMLWGSVYTYGLLNLWLKCMAKNNKMIGDPSGTVQEKMNRFISIEANLGIGGSFYDQLKSDGKL